MARVQPLLRPILQARSVIERFEDFVRQSFSPELVIAYVLGLGDRNSYVMKKKLEAWSVAIDEVHDAAIANLEKMSAGLTMPKPAEQPQADLLIVDTGDSYDAERLLLPVFRARLLAAIGPSLRAGVQDRNALLVWSSDFPSRKALEDEVRREAVEMPYALSDEIFEIDARGVRRPHDSAAP